MEEYAVKSGPQAVADLFGELHEAIEVTYGPSRERSLCLTNLEQAEMWVAKAAQ